MASLILTIPDAHVVPASNGLGYKTTIQDPVDPDNMISNPENRGQFMKRKLIEYIKASYEAYRVNIELDNKRLEIIEQVESELTIT